MNLRSKLTYGKTISTVGPPLDVAESVIWNVKLQLLSVRFWCSSSLSKYNPVDGSNSSPSSCSNILQESAGSQSNGSVESMKVFIAVGRKEVVRGLVEVIEFKPTTRFLEISGAREKEVLLGTNRDRS